MHNIFDIKRLCDENKKLKKAIDKACKLIAEYNSCMASDCPFECGTNKCGNPEAWKEWLLKDD